MRRTIALIATIILVFLPSISYANINENINQHSNNTENSEEESEADSGRMPEEVEKDTDDMQEVKQDTNDIEKIVEKDNLEGEKKTDIESNSLLNKENTDSIKEQGNSSGDVKEKERSIETKSTKNVVNQKSADEWYKDAMNVSTASGRVDVFVDAYEYFPNNEKIISGLNSSVRNLLDWASRQHNSGEFETAIDRYNYIISLAGINNNIIEEATWKKDYAKKNLKHPEPDELYDNAISEHTATGRLEAFIEAYKLFPEDNRLKKGVHNSAKLLLNWAIQKHNSGEFETATDRYKYILEAPTLPDSVRLETESRLTKAQENIRPANIIYNQALSESSASKKFELYIEGNNAYPNDTRFSLGIVNSGKALLNWARKQHQSGNFETATDRYNRILQEQNISSLLEDSAKRHLNNAQRQLKVPSINELVKSITKQATVSGIFTYTKEAFLWYPENNSFKEELDTAASQLLNWAKKQHDNGQFDIAKNRYEILLATPYIAKKIRIEADIYLEKAENGERTADAIYQDAVKETRVSYKLSLFVEGYNLYPNDSRFTKGIQESSNSLLNWAITKHHSGEYETAINRYEQILDTPTISNTVRNKATDKLLDAKIGKRPADVIYSSVQKATNASELFNLNLEGYQFYPSDSRFRKGLEDGAKALFNLATRYHTNNDFIGATSRYETLISTDGVPRDLKTKSKYQLQYSLLNEAVPHINEYITYAQNQGTASGILNAFVEGYLLYDEDPLMAKGIIDSAYGLLNWANLRHQEGQFATALDRYNIILGLPVMDDNLKKEVELKIEYANKEQKIPTAEELVNKAVEHPSASHKLNAYLEGYILYPEDSRFYEGISTSSNALLNLAIRYHQEGAKTNSRFEDAVVRYETILSTSEIPELIRLEAELRKKYAVQRKQIPSANTLNNSANKDTTASGKFNKYVEGYIFYPSDQRFSYGISTSAYELFNYASRLHEKRNYSGAIARYNSLITAPGVPHYIVIDSIKNMQLASERKLPQIDTVILTQYGMTLNKALEIQMRATPQTDQRNPKHAWVSKNYVDKNNRVTANLNVRIGPGSNYASVGTVRNGTTIKVLDEHNGWYAIEYSHNNQWTHAGPTDVRYYLNPLNFVNDNRQIFQFLDLSRPSGASASVLNNFLKGKGTLSGQGQAFIDAGRIYGVNDVYLISHAILETGNGSSDLAKGIEVGLNKNNVPVRVTKANKSSLTKIKKVYNMFGIQAYDSCPNTCGSTHAYEQGWDTPYKAIVGGARFIGEDYIQGKNDEGTKLNTIYKMRWNPEFASINGRYGKQYATDVGWASKQINNMYNLYQQIGSYTLYLDIPEYR